MGNRKKRPAAKKKPQPRSKRKKASTADPQSASPPPMGAVVMERVAVEKIKPAPYNPRVALQPGDPAYEKLKRSIAEFGSVDPLIWNKRTGNLVGGHQRLAVLMGEHFVTEVDVSVVDLPLEKEKLLNVALNKVAGQWDDPTLASLLLELQEVGEDATIAGFDLAEIDRILDSADEPEPNTDPQLSGLEHRVVVLCAKGERQQLRLIARLEREGYTCNALIS